MKIIKLARGAGKTEAAIKLAAKTKATIICRDKYSIDYIERLAQYLQKSIRKPITYDSLFNTQFKPPRQVILDDFDSWIRTKLSFLLKSSELIGLTTEATNLSQLLYPNKPKRKSPEKKKCVLCNGTQELEGGNFCSCRGKANWSKY